MARAIREIVEDAEARLQEIEREINALPADSDSANALLALDAARQISACAAALRLALRYRQALESYNRALDSVAQVIGRSAA